MVPVGAYPHGTIRIRKSSVTYGDMKGESSPLTIPPPGERGFRVHTRRQTLRMWPLGALSLVFKTLAGADVHCPSHAAPTIGSEHRTLQARLAIPLAVVALITAMYARCAGTACDTVTRDEAFSWRFIQYPLPELVARATEDVHPLLYYIVLKSWSSVFGQSILSLRCMSILFAIATIPILMSTVREACAHSRRGHDGSTRTGPAGALLTAALFALHTSQIYPARDARMYSMGVFLAVLTSRLLLRSLRPGHVEVKWWLAYGIAVGAFFHTHNYAHFTIAGQWAFGLGDLLRKLASGQRAETRHQAQALLLAGTLAIMIYIPWVPVLLHQFEEVRTNYWIPEVSWGATIRVLTSWGGGARIISSEGGSEFVTGLDIVIWTSAIVLLALSTLAFRHRGLWFFLLQATVPWAFSLGFSVLADRSIFHERYLIFSQVFLLGLWGVLFEQIRHFAFRTCVIWLLAITVFYNGVSTLTQISWQASPAAQAMHFVKAHRDQDDDMMAVATLGEVNRLRYYAYEVGMKDLDIRAVGAPSHHSGHTTHIASLSDADFTQPEEWPSGEYRRIWLVAELNQGAAIPLPSGMEEIDRRTFTRDHDISELRNQDGFIVILYDKTR